jgi:hypothetical protein
MGSIHTFAGRYTRSFTEGMPENANLSFIGRARRPLL